MVRVTDLPPTRLLIFQLLQSLLKRRWWGLVFGTKLQGKTR